MNTIQIITLAVIKDKKLLLVRHQKNKEIFYQLGGKIQDKETDTDCLIREVKEEINADINIDSLEFLHEFECKAFNKKNTLINNRLYKADFKQKPQPSSEILEIRYFDSFVANKYLTQLGIEVIKWLKEKNYID